MKRLSEYYAEHIKEYSEDGISLLNKLKGSVAAMESVRQMCRPQENERPEPPVPIDTVEAMKHYLSRLKDLENDLGKFFFNANSGEDTCKSQERFTTAWDNLKRMSLGPSEK